MIFPLQKILLDNDKCHTCRACELSCSYHKSAHKFFNPRISSTRVSRNNENGKITIYIDSNCDLCMKETQPLCVKYCAYGALAGGNGDAL